MFNEIRDMLSSCKLLNVCLEELECLQVQQCGGVGNFHGTSQCNSESINISSLVAD